MAIKATCKAADCNHEVIAKGYCRKHYRLWKHGEMPKPRYKICTAEKCRKPRFRGSLCEEHWQTAHAKAGETPAAAAPTPAPAAAPAEGA
jgi:hypothetical protein